MSQQEVEDFIIDGKTTKTELIEKFGKPTQEIIESDTTHLSFSYQTGINVPEHFLNTLTFGIPSLITGPGDYENIDLSVILDKNDVVKSHHYQATVTNL
jgi:hypothetical protein